MPLIDEGKKAPAFSLNDHQHEQQERSDTGITRIAV
jgi:hypothetical protein